MPSIRDLLKDTGIKLDPDYGPYLVNPKLGHYIVRGSEDQGTQEKAKQVPGVSVS
jgi:hypothetical protein